MREGKLLWIALFSVVIANACFVVFVIRLLFDKCNDVTFKFAVI